MHFTNFLFTLCSEMAKAIADEPDRPCFGENLYLYQCDLSPALSHARTKRRTSWLGITKSLPPQLSYIYHIPIGELLLWHWFRNHVENISEKYKRPAENLPNTQKTEMLSKVVGSLHIYLKHDSKFVETDEKGSAFFFKPYFFFWKGRRPPLPPPVHPSYVYVGVLWGPFGGHKPRKLKEK